MKPYKVGVLLVCMCAILASSCVRTQEETRTTNVIKPTNADTSRPEVLSSPGKYKERLDIIVSKLTNAKEYASCARTPKNVRDAVDLVEHSIHMRTPIYHCIKHRGFYVMTDQTYRAKNLQDIHDILLGNKRDLDDSLLFSTGFAIKTGERIIRRFSVK